MRTIGVLEKGSGIPRSCDIKDVSWQGSRKTQWNCSFFLYLGRKLPSLPSGKVCPGSRFRELRDSWGAGLLSRYGGNKSVYNWNRNPLLNLSLELGKDTLPRIHPLLFIAPLARQKLWGNFSRKKIDQNRVGNQHLWVGRWLAGKGIFPPSLMTWVLSLGAT